MLYTPRYYQDEALVSLRVGYEKGENRQLIHSATGTGKTTTVQHLPQRFPELFDGYGMAFMVHRREILFDTAKAFAKAYPFVSIGIEMGENHATGTEQIVFFSVDSIGRDISTRINKYRRRHFGIFVTDEAHHATPNSIYDNVMGFFGVGSGKRGRLPNGSLPLSVLLTATPGREDDKTIRPMFDRVAYTYDARTAVRDGYLVDIMASQAIADAGDSIEEQVNLLMRILQTHGPGEKTLLFASSVEESEMLANSLNKHGILRAAHVDANTPRSEREEIIRRFNSGDLDLLSNRLVYTEGWDSPNITQIIDNANTKSATLFRQKIGRGMRPHAMARVDDYDTAEQRRAAIKRSPKEALKYVATFAPTSHSLSPSKVIWGVNIPMSPKPTLITELVDVIQNVAEEQPDRPVAQIIAQIQSATVQYLEADVWNGTIYNKELQALTSLRWIKTDDGAAIYFPINPRAKREYDQVPTIYHYSHDGNGGYNLFEIQTGGWLTKLKRPRKKSVAQIGRVSRLEDGIRRIDRWLKENRPDTYTILLRDNSGLITETQKRYLDRHGIGYTTETRSSVADTLIEHHRIMSHLDI